MMGQLFEVSNAAKRMAHTFIKIFGKGREDLAMTITGFLVSIPIYCDSGFVILFPVAKALSKSTRKSIITLGLALASGLVITHTVVPPTPGPVGAAGIFGANVGAVILWGILIAIPMVISTLLYANWYGKKVYQLPDEDGEWIRPERISNVKAVDYSFDEDGEMPSTFTAFLPIVAPIILILINTIISTLIKVGKVETSPLLDALMFIGTPIVAVGFGLLIAIFTLTKGMDRHSVITEMETGIQSAGIIILVTGGGGALGRVLTDSGVGNDIANY